MTHESSLIQLSLLRTWSRITNYSSLIQCSRSRFPVGYTSVGALHKSNVHSRTIWGNPKLWALCSNACALLWHLHFLFHTGPPIKRVWDRSDLTQNDGNMSTRENRELWGKTKQHRGMKDFSVQRTRSRNEVPLTLIRSMSSEISQKVKIIEYI